MNAGAVRRKLADSISLIKPRITTVTLLTTFTGIWLAGSGTLPNGQTLFFLLFGTGLGVSSSCLLNNYFDRFIDRKMSRTKNRPLPAGRMAPSIALVAGIGFGFIGTILLAAFVNPLAASLLLLSILNYAVLYTLWFKRNTPYATEVVGVSGALAPVIGWVGVTGTMSMLPVFLFAMIFLWQPGHFWALGLLYRKDYQNAELPRYPVVFGVKGTKRRLLIYTVLLSSLPVFLTWYTGMQLPFLVAAGLVSASYLFLVVRFQYQKVTRSNTLTVFFGSIVYLCLMILLLILSAALPGF